MTIVDIEFEISATHQLPLFIEETAKDINEGYGAGTCTVDANAFWSLYAKKKIRPGWRLLHIELDGDNLKRHEISAAVRSVQNAPSGQIQVLGNTVGRWKILNTLDEKGADA